ncbi:ATP synthase F1 subunit epsilon [Pirellulales bacterium]|nr:ATP synthase F1 subunit epsilon [Pirellulales bacterium]
MLKCIVVTPEQTVLETETDFVALPLFDGEIGIARGHAPMIGRLGYGELRIRQEGETTRLYVDGGFVQVADNVVSVLTNRAIPPAELDAGTIEQEIADALRQPTAGEEALTLRTRTLDQARGQLRVAKRK